MASIYRSIIEGFSRDFVGCTSKVVFSSRWLLAPLYVGLSSVIFLFIFKFFRKLYSLVIDLPGLTDQELTLGVLHLVDIVMLANLTIMITVGSYSLFIRRLTIRDSRDRLTWLDHIDAGALKVKLGMALIGVSSVHLLEAFIKVDEISMEAFYKMAGIHMVFVISTLVVAFIGVMKYGPSKKLEAPEPEEKEKKEE